MASEHPARELIKDRIRQQIAAGELLAGDRVPSEFELVSQLGVSRNQTRQALRELELEGYLIRRKGSGSYVAPQAGQGGNFPLLEQLRTVTVAFPHYASLYVRQVIEGVMSAMFRAGLGVANYNIQFDEAMEVRFLSSLEDNGAAGLVIWLGNETDAVRDCLIRLKERQFPVVLADRCFPDVDLDFVASNNDEIGYRLTRALIERGHERIGFVYSLFDKASSQAERIDGYRRALEEAEIPFLDELMVPVDDTAAARREAVNAVMAQAKRPTAFVHVNDYACCWIYEELTRLGYRIPEDVAFATVDDDDRGHLPEVPVITIRQNGLEIGAQCAELLLARMSDPARPVEHRRVPPGPVAEIIGSMAIPSRD